jgi:ABC-type transport system involved in cytochrome c biogenesis permease component
MKNIVKIFKNDFSNFISYRILHMVVILSVLFGLIMGVFVTVEPLVFVYITIFIFPVITFSISFFIEREENTIIPILTCECKPIEIISAKVLSATTLQLVPFIIYSFIMKIMLNMNFNLILFFLIFIVGIILHILIGLALAIISKSNFAMSMSYIVYIIVFSIVPFLSLSNAVPESMKYFLIISPAFLSGVLFENLILGYLYSEQLLVILAAILQVVYIFVLIFLVIRPFFKKFLVNTYNNGVSK